LGDNGELNILAIKQLNVNIASCGITAISITNRGSKYGGKLNISNELVGAHYTTLCTVVCLEFFISFFFFFLTKKVELKFFTDPVLSSGQGQPQVQALSGCWESCPSELKPLLLMAGKGAFSHPHHSLLVDRLNIPTH
jgi:hypothetical protein